MGFGHVRRGFKLHTDTKHCQFTIYYIYIYIPRASLGFSAKHMSIIIIPPQITELTAAAVWRGLAAATATEIGEHGGFSTRVRGIKQTNLI